MNRDELKQFADDEQRSIEDFSKIAKTLSHEKLNDELNSVFSKHKPLREEQIRLAMRMLILSQEIRIRMLKKAFPNIKLQEISTLCELLPSDQVVGDTEKWIAQMQASGRIPRIMQIDRIKRSIVLLE
jgi:hypothetical protein